MLKEELKRIAKIQIKMDRMARGLFSGLYLSHFKGRGIEFEEVREFQPGDEIRSVDWNVTARMGTPFVKLFREERELTLILMLDISGSMLFGSNEQIKRTILSEIAAIFAFSAIKNRDKVGLLLFTDQVEHYVPPRKGVRHVLRLIRDLLAYPGKSRGTDLGKALSYLGRVEKKRGVLFLLSDFIKVGDLKRALTVTAKKHDLIAIAIQDPLERALPSAPLMQLQDMENGDVLLVDPKDGIDLREGNRAHVKKAILQAGGSFIDVATDKPYLPALLRFLSSRRRA